MELRLWSTVTVQLEAVRVDRGIEGAVPAGNVVVTDPGDMSLIPGPVVAFDEGVEV